MPSITALTDQIENIQARIERIEGKPQTDRNVARVERLNRRMEILQGKIDVINRDAALQEQWAAEAAESNLPMDTFEITFKQPDAERSFHRFEVDIYDSSFDDKFIGGEPLLLQFSATKQTNRGRKTWRSTSALANGRYWKGLNEQQLMLGSSRFEELTDYTDVTVYLAKDTGESPMQIAADDILAIQTFDMTTLFV